MDAKGNRFAIAGRPRRGGAATSARATASRMSATAGVLGWLAFCAWTAAGDAAPYRVTGTGFVTDRGHPMNPADFHTYDFTARVTFDPVPGEAVIAIEFGPTDSLSASQRNRYRYHVRRGRIFQVNDQGAEILPAPVGDVPPAVVAALHPALVLDALRERPECVRQVAGGRVFAWNDELWTVDLDPAPQGRGFYRVNRLAGQAANR